MSRKICVITGTRAEYGLLRWVMQGIKDDPDLTLQVIATGMHLSPEFGLTWREILALGGPTRGWWRRAVQQAETDGLLEWNRERLAWSLTDAGREVVKEVA